MSTPRANCQKRLDITKKKTMRNVEIEVLNCPK